jgi:predicted transcriptional regulator
VVARVRKSILFEGITVTLLILLIFMLIAMIMGESGGPSERSIPGSDQVQYIYTGSDNTLYMFYENHIQAIDAKSNELWDFNIPNNWKVASGWRFDLTYTQDTPLASIDINGGPIVFVDNSTLYVYLKPNETYTGGPADSANGERMGEGMIAISEKGNMLWSLPLHSLAVNVTQYSDSSVGHYDEMYSDARIYARDGRVYVYHDYNETVVADNGTILWSVDNVAGPASVDEYGFVYCVPAQAPAPEYSQPPLESIFSWGHMALDDYLVPSAIVDAYYPNGTQYWRKYPGEPLYRQYISDERLPLYNNGTIYASLENGIAAFDRQGNEKWVKKYNPDEFYFEYTATNSTGFTYSSFTQSDFSLYSPMPFDSKGDVYLQYLSRNWIPQSDRFMAPALPEFYLITIGPDGNEIARNVISQGIYRAVNNGIGYNISMPDVYPMNVDNLTDMRTKSLIAYNVNNGTKLWEYTFPVENPTIVTVDASNAADITPYLTLNDPYPVIDENTTSEKLGHANISITEIRAVMVGDGRVYAQFSSVNYEIPVVYGRSKAAYVSSVYTLDENGSLLWSKTITPNVYAMSVVNNSTIMYRNNDGKLVVTNAGTAVGFALTTFLYIFIRFFCIGAIARAHSRINKNVNRNAVYSFIVKNPGSTMYEVSRGLHMNLGTVRYHTFILGMNHRIVSYKEDGKYIRYFTNSNSYSKDDQFIVSLLRRDAVGKVLGYMATQPAASNAEIARELGIQESIVSRCIKELSEKGVLVKEPSGIRSAYTIVDSHRERVASIMRRIYSE